MSSKSMANDDLKSQLAGGERIGSILRGERLTMGLEIPQVHQALKIRPEIIEAIENNDLQAIGRPQFVSGYIRSYAKLLKLNPDTVLNAYVDQCGLQRTPPGMIKKDADAMKNFQFSARQPKIGDRFRVITRTTSLALPLILVFAILGAVVYGGARMFNRIQTLDIVPTESRPAALTENEMAELDQNADESIAKSMSINYDDLYQSQALQTPVITPRAGRIADVDVNAVGAFGATAPVPQVIATATPTTVAATPVALTAATSPSQSPVVTVGPSIPQVQLLPRSEAWVRLTNEDGEVIFEKLLQPGEVVDVPFKGSIPVLRKAGNATGLFVRVNGKVFGPLGKDGASVVQNVPLTPEAIDTSYDEIDPNLSMEIQNVVSAFLNSSDTQSVQAPATDVAAQTPNATVVPTPVVAPQTQTTAQAPRVSQ